MSVTVRDTIDLVAVRGDVDDRYWARLDERVRSEFRVDLYRPAPGDVALRIYVSCAVPGCRGRALRNERLCRTHNARWVKDGSPPVDDWLSTLHDLPDPKTGERPPLRLTAHRFRHTIATRMLNEDVPDWVVQRFLGHESPEMTARYAALHDKTLREHFDRFQHRVTAAGQVVQLIAEEPIGEGMQLAERLRRARQTLPNGYCARPVQTDCIHPNFCHGCTQFATDVTFLPVLRGQHQRASSVLQLAQDEGRDRWVERNQRDIVQLNTIITALEGLPEANDFPT